MKPEAQWYLVEALGSARGHLGILDDYEAKQKQLSHFAGVLVGFRYLGVVSQDEEHDWFRRMLVALGSELPDPAPPGMAQAISVGDPANRPPRPEPRSAPLFVRIAETTDQTSSTFAATITLDKGTAQGVDFGNAVVTRAGLVGQVISVARNSCVVRLITDSQSKVGIVYGASGQYAAVAEGQGQDVPMTADFVPTNKPIRVGEEIVTSQLSGASLPSGIPVATVASVHTPPGATQKAVTLKPSVRIGQFLMYVAVMQWSPPLSN